MPNCLWRYPARGALFKKSAELMVEHETAAALTDDLRARVCASMYVKKVWYNADQLHEHTWPNEVEVR